MAVYFLDGALNSEMPDFISTELQSLWPKADVFVHDSFVGYRPDPKNKLVLAVEVQNGESISRHVVKIGSQKQVGSDIDGWNLCGLRGQSRILVPIQGVDLPKDQDGNERLAVIYQDAYQYYNNYTIDQRPVQLETAVLDRLLGGGPSVESIERVLRQIYADLYFALYQRSEPKPCEAVEFYSKKLDPTWDLWGQGELHRDRERLVWLFCGNENPNALLPPKYIDPIHYVQWALKDKVRLPKTLVGKAHGDLHALNILVGIHRGEAEYASIYDYGHMKPKNVVCWDSVKMETELTVRMLVALYARPEVQEELRKPETLLPLDNDQPDRENIARQCQFAAAFERLLINHSRFDAPAKDRYGREEPLDIRVKSPFLRDALKIILRIRREAFLLLGVHQSRHNDDWKQEYLFAQAAYAANVAKFENYLQNERRFALVAGGIALSELESAREHLAKPYKPGEEFPSYHVPLAWVYSTWKQRDHEEMERAMKTINKLVEHKHAIPLIRDCALVSLSLNLVDETEKWLQPLQDDAMFYDAVEMLARIAKIPRLRAEEDLKSGGIDVARSEFANALKLYEEIFRITKNYFHGSNATHIAWLIGEEERARELAEKLLIACETPPPNEPRFWVTVTRADAYLILGKAQVAANFYKRALNSLTEEDGKIGDVPMNQVEHLHQYAPLDNFGLVQDVFQEYKTKRLEREREK